VGSLLAVAGGTLIDLPSDLSLPAWPKETFSNCGGSPQDSKVPWVVTLAHELITHMAWWDELVSDIVLVEKELAMKDSINQNQQLFLLPE
jgi:hypothetical protein